MRNEIEKLAERATEIFTIHCGRLCLCLPLSPNEKIADGRK